METKKLLLVEDDKGIAMGLEYSLRQEGFETVVCTAVRPALERLQTERFDLAILDLSLPDGTGYDVCRAIKAKNDGAAVIFLTARDDEGNIVMGLDMGADDYMTKPFAIEELLARIRVLLKRRARGQGGGAESSTLRAGGLTLDKKSYAVAYNGEPIALTKKEFDLLCYLMEHAGQVVTRDMLLNDVWGYEYAGDTNIVDVYIRYLRTKIDEKTGVKYLHTVRGVGYMLRYEE